MANRPVVIVGAGLAGLACARTLQSAGRSVVVLDAADDIGGRVRTDRVDGFLIDRGFQVLLTSYPCWTSCDVDLKPLDLHAFQPGAIVRKNGRFHRYVDPFRRPWDVIPAALAPVGSLVDKLRVGLLRSSLGRGSPDRLWAKSEQSTGECLKAMGFSPSMIEGFFRPFFAGVFLESDLATSSRLFEFLFRMFSQGDATLPREGMGALPRRLAETLPRESIRLRSPVAAVEPRCVRLENGETIDAECVVVATDGTATARLLGRPDVVGEWNGSITLSFDAPQSRIIHASACVRFFRVRCGWRLAGRSGGRSPRGSSPSPWVVRR